MERKKLQHIVCNKQALKLLLLLSQKLKNLYSKLRFLIIQRRPKPRVIIRGLQKLGSKRRSSTSLHKRSEIHLNGLRHHGSEYTKPVRVATFNAALFAVAPVLPNKQLQLKPDRNGYPKSILKNNPTSISVEQSRFSKSKLRVSIDVPENEISLSEDNCAARNHWNNVPVRSPLCFPMGASYAETNYLSFGTQTIWEVLREVDADILALQDVKTDEERGMQPLRDLADALGMSFVFAESWAPEYGNAVLSKWPITQSKVQKILNHEDIRNVLKATVDVPWMGEVNVYCTQLDYLDEDWRMKQVKAIIESSEGPHILAGGLNSLDSSDYSSARWTDIVKYFEDIGKPKPKTEVMKFLKGKAYTDAKDYAGHSEPQVIIPKGQNVQGTCKYGTRVDYILSSPNSPYRFLPGSYSVVSSKGTSDHHVVKVDIIKDGHDTSLQQKLIGALSLIKARG